MGFVPQITCRNCGTKFSALRGRCPNCGTRHVKQSGRTVPAAPAAPGAEGGASPARQRSAPPAANGNGRWQMIFGAVLIVSVIIAVIILISASLNQTAPEPVDTPPPPVDITTPPPTTPPPTPTPTPTVGVTSVTITFLNSPVTEFTQRISWGSIQLGADVYPTEALGYSSVEWRSSDESVCTVDETGLVTPVGSGECEIIAECGGVATRCRVLVP